MVGRRDPYWNGNGAVTVPDMSQQELAEQVLSLARQQGIKVATAESCTGGLIAGALTDIAGSSDVVDRGFVTYSNEAKQQMLDVKAQTIQQFGAVSETTAKEMAYGALAHSMADITVSVTGVAGPGGGTADKPVGLVWFGLAQVGQPPLTEKKLFGDIGRQEVRVQTVMHALEMLKRALGGA